GDPRSGRRLHPFRSTKAWRMSLSSSSTLTGECGRNLINVLKLSPWRPLAGGARERALELRLLAAQGGRYCPLSGLWQRLADDPAGCSERNLARLGRAA